MPRVARAVGRSGEPARTSPKAHCPRISFSLCTVRAVSKVATSPGSADRMVFFPTTLHAHIHAVPVQGELAGDGAIGRLRLS